MECESILFVKNQIPYLWDLSNSFSNSFIDVYSLNTCSPVSPTRFRFGGRGWDKGGSSIYLQNGVCRVEQCKDCEGRFSFFSLHLRSKCTFEGLTNEQEMCSRIVEWKGMGFTMSRYIRRTISLRDQPLQSCKNYSALYESFMVWGKR